MSRLPVLIGLVFACGACTSPNAYKAKRDAKGFGYEGAFLESRGKANEGWVSFTGDENITRMEQRQRCWRRIAQMCRRRGYEYFAVIGASSGRGQTTVTKSRYAGTKRGVDDETYHVYEFWEARVPTLGKRMRFLAYNGPLPPSKRPGNYYYRVDNMLNGEYVVGYADGQDADTVRCDQCGKTTDRVSEPEICPSCDGNLYKRVICPHCSRLTEPEWDGPNECDRCNKVYRVSFCPSCSRRHVLNDFLPYDCSYCSRPSESGIEAGVERFRCPHCRHQMEWPKEKWGQYDCAKCRELFTAYACARCGMTHAKAVPGEFTCWGCGYLVKPHAAPSR